MKQYHYNQTHERVKFSARDVFAIRPVLASVTNPHPTFASIRERFQDDDLNISKKQADVLDWGLRAAGLPSLAELTAKSPFASVSFQASKEFAVRSVLMLIGGGGYGDWRYASDFRDLASLKVLEVLASDGSLYLGFVDERDRDSAEVGLYGAGWLS